MLAWFVSPWLFIVMSAGVVLALYPRAFHCDVLHVMVYTQTEAPTAGPIKETAAL